MTSVPGPHLTPDDLDAWLAGALAPAAQDHLAVCPACQERADTEREIVDAARRAAADEPGRRLRRSGHGAGRGARAGRRALARSDSRVFATRRSRWPSRPACSRCVAGSMAGSIVWTLGHQETLAALGTWLAGQAGQAAWIGLRAVASNFIEQPWFAGLRDLAGSPGRLGLASALALIAYLGGVLALRRLLALPTQQVAHAGRLAGPSRLLALIALLVPRAAFAGTRPDPDRVTGRGAGARFLVPRIGRLRTARRRGRHPGSPSRAPGHPPGARRRAAGLARRPQQAHHPRVAAARGAPATRRRRSRHRSRRHGAAGRLQHRLQRERAGPPARGAGHRGRLRQAARQSGHRRGRRGAAPRRRHLRGRAHARRRGPRRRRRDRRRGADLPLGLGADAPLPMRAAEPSAIATVFRRAARGGRRVPHARRPRVRPGDVRPAQPRGGIRHRLAFVRPRLRDRAPGSAPAAPHLRHAGGRAHPQRRGHRAAAVRGGGVRAAGRRGSGRRISGRGARDGRDLHPAADGARRR